MLAVPVYFKLTELQHENMKNVFSASVEIPS